MLRCKITSAFGIGIYVHWTFLFVPLYVCFTMWGSGYHAVMLSLALVLTVFGCVVLHELGHAQMARFFGIRTRDIVLYPIGGVARLERMPEAPWQEFFIALAGPAVNVVLVAMHLAIIVPAWLILGEAFPRSTLGGFVLGLCVANAFLVLFNLIPAFPMDGGRVLRALLSFSVGRLRATVIASRISLVLAGLMIVGGLVLLPLYPSNPTLLPLVGLFVLLAGRYELAMVRRRERLRRAQAVPVVAVLEPVVEVEPRPADGFQGYAWTVPPRD